MPPRTPSLVDVIDEALDDFRRGLWTAAPGIVQAYDATTQTASVQPAVMNAYYDEEGNRVAERMPVIHDVQVQFPSVTFPLKKGDTCLLVFCSSSIDIWSARGGEVDPRDERRFSLSDAVCIPGLRSRKGAIESVPIDATVLWGDDVRLGAGDASDPVVRRSDLALVVERLETHQHQVSGQDNGGDVFTTTSNTPTGTFLTPECSLTVKAK